MAKQLSLNLVLHNNAGGKPATAPVADQEGAAKRLAAGKHHIMCRTVLRWLEETQAPTAMALNVATKNRQFRADIAAFWSETVRNPHEEGPARIQQPLNTMIVQCYTEREVCWPDCAKSAELLAHLAALKDQLQACEEKIRRKEPHLRDGDMLFSEYANWRYEETKNPDYHRLKREIEATEHALYQGTMFERIRGAHLADRLYLAVPEGMVMPAELSKGWGLLWIDSRLGVREMVQPEVLECIKENRLHLLQNIAAANKQDLLFRQGLARRGADGRVFMVQPPRGHRRPQSGLLSV